MEVAESLELKTVGRSGQITLGKALAGQHFFVDRQTSGDVLLRHAMVVPTNEQWLHTPEMRSRLAAADAWMAANPPQETNLDELTQRLGDKLGAKL